MEADDLNRTLRATAGGVGAPGGGSALPGVVAVGVDLVEVDRIAATLARRPGLADRLFTPGERAYCEAGRRPAPRYAVRFAAKEAAMKTLGVGLGAVGWHDIEVLRAEGGEPSLKITGRAAALATEQGGTRWLVSLTHTDAIAEAVVLLCGL